MTKQDLFQECKVVLIFENWPVHASVTLFPEDYKAVYVLLK